VLSATTPLTSSACARLAISGRRAKRACRSTWLDTNAGTDVVAVVDDRRRGLVAARLYPRIATNAHRLVDRLAVDAVLDRAEQLRVLGVSTLRAHMTSASSFRSA